MFDRMQAWSLLLPTAEERATALAALLQRGDGDHGSRFIVPHNELFYS